MIKLRNTEGQIELERSVIEYASLEPLSEDWCLVKTSVRHNKRTFETVEPSLEAFELISLLQWFKSLAEFKLARFIIYGKLS